MNKILRVINPFFTVEAGDLFEYSEDTNMYVARHKEEFYKMDDNSVNEVKSSYSSEFQISVDYAKSLIEDGYLEEVTGNEKPFVNIFDEIDNLLEKYETGLKNLENDTAGLPACVKVERETVLNNLVTLLTHLKSLKK